MPDSPAMQVEIDYKAECHSGDTVEALGRHVDENTNGTGVRRQALLCAAVLCVAICDCMTAAWSLCLCRLGGMVVFWMAFEWHFQQPGAEFCTRWPAGLAALPSLCWAHPSVHAADSFTFCDAVMNRVAESLSELELHGGLSESSLVTLILWSASERGWWQLLQ